MSSVCKVFSFASVFSIFAFLIVFCGTSVSWKVALGSNAGASFLFCVFGFLVPFLLPFAFWIALDFEDFVLECGIVVLMDLLFLLPFFCFWVFLSLQGYQEHLGDWVPW